MRRTRRADEVGAADSARALVRLASDPVERWRRRALALDRAASLPTWDESVAAFDALLLRVTGRLS